MQSNILELCRIEIKTPSDSTTEEIVKFHELVVKGGKVMLNGLLERIRRCELLAFCYYDGKLLGVSSIKKPSLYYAENIIHKTKIDRKPAELKFEIGYSFTEPEFRRNGISKALKKHLLEQMKYKKGIVFSTTAMQSSQNFLEENGFVKKGNSYDGDNDKGITYYEKEF